jgi:predicted Zn-dependent protease with MMP-like domain
MRNMKPMSLDRFGRMVARVMKALPEEFYPFLENLVVDVEEEPDPEMLRRSGYTNEEIHSGAADLFGLFVPLGSTPVISREEEDELPQEFPFDFLDQPHRLIIYKGPHERAFPDPRQLRIEVRKTVIHELAHHFGFEERDLEPFDDNPDPFGDGLPPGDTKR